jgi:hypothetical protein
MGKYALLLTFSVGLALAYFGQQSMQISSAANEDQVERQKTVLARQIARSAFNNAVSNIKRDWCSVPTGTEEPVPYEQGEYEVTFGFSGGGEEGEDSSGEDSCAGKRITATVTSYYPGKEDTDKVSYQIEGTAEQRKMVSGLFSGLTASGALSQLRVNGCGGGNCVSGDPGGGEGRPGMNLPGSMAEDLDGNGCPSNGWGKGDIVAGSESVANECGVQVRGAADDKWVTGKMSAIRSEIESELESSNPSSDITVCGEGGNDTGPPDDEDTGPPEDRETGPPNQRGPFALASMSAEIDNRGGRPPGDCSIDGEGILLVPEGKTARANGGPPRWDGFVYVEEGGTIRINGGGSTQSISGGLLMEGGSNFRMNGGERVQYDPDELRKYVDLLPSIETTEVTITDRTSKVVGSNE